MTIENVTTPGQPPQPGDIVRITHPSGAIEEREYHAPTLPGPVDALDQAKASRLDAVRAKRWEVEAGGIVIAGTTIQTDDKSQSRIIGAVLYLDKSPTATSVNWEAQPTVWIEVSKATMDAIGLAVGDHVQACFNRMMQLQEAITGAADLAALEAIDIDSGWPS